MQFKEDLAKKPDFVAYKQQRCRQACASAKSDLISTFVSRYLEGKIAKCSHAAYKTSKILVAEHASRFLDLFHAQLN